jgi:CO dehydrogenase/acetyl-CoA synthase gamma subunit (corrinoid Fe-S protein)
MPLKANLYIDRVDPLRYFSPVDCGSCGYASCGEWLLKLREGSLSPADCPSLGPNRAHALEVTLSLDRLLPEVEITQHPVAGLLGRQDINGPGPEAPVLVTGNGLATQEVVLAVLSTTTAPFHLLFVDCLGHTVDMAMIYGTFTPEALLRATESSDLAGAVTRRELILPGVAVTLKEAFEARTGWGVRIGPHCVGELPLFFGDIWARPERAANGF